MTQFDPSVYGSVLAELLHVDRNRPLGPGESISSARARLAALDAPKLFPDRTIVAREMAELCLSAVWLLHDFLDESHTISQGVHSSSGSYWHAIMHRREPDESNAKYWIRRVGDHPVYDRLQREAKALAQQAGATGQAAFLTTQSGWDADSFVEVCASARRGASPWEALCRRIQQAECELLFDYCYRAAVGEPTAEG